MKNGRALVAISAGVALGAAIASACGSGGAPAGGSDGGSSSSGGSSGAGSSGGSTGSSSGGGSSSSSSGSSSSGGATMCAQLHCAVPQICCAVRPSAGAAPTLLCADVSTCTAANSVTCFGGDCPTGQLCCGPSGTSQPLGTSCLAACNPSGAMSRPLCSTSSDAGQDSSLCAPGDTCSRSAAPGSTGGLYSTCHPPDGGGGADEDGAVGDDAWGGDSGGSDAGGG